MRPWLIIVGFLVSACGSGKQNISPPEIIEPTAQDDWTRARESDPELSKEMFTAGQQIYQGQCQQCHPLREHELLDAEGWRSIVPSMVKKVNKRELIIDAEQEAVLLRYLLALAKDS